MFGISVQKNESDINFAYINLSNGVISFYSGGENVRQMKDRTGSVGNFAT